MIEQSIRYITCEYCGTTQQMMVVLRCLGCGAPMTDTTSRFPGISDLMRDQRAYAVGDKANLWCDWNDPS